MWLLLGAIGCVVVDDCPQCPMDCADIAIRNRAGVPDGCDVAACDACTDRCGGRCLVLERWPPIYSCPDDEWDVYDFCPDWTSPDGIAAVEVDDLGCGDDTGEGELLQATSTAPDRIDVTHRDYATGCCPAAVEVDVSRVDHTLEVTYTPIDDVCDCICLLDVRYALVGMGGGTWTVRTQTAAATVDVPF